MIVLGGVSHTGTLAAAFTLSGKLVSDAEVQEHIMTHLESPHLELISHCSDGIVSYAAA